MCENKESVLVEIRAAEGGMHASLIVIDQLGIYIRWAARKGLECLVLEQAEGFVVLQVTGKGAREAFQHEAGGHRFQGISPTDKQKRVHTSSITVAILDLPQESAVKLDERDLEYKTCRSGSKGGQHVNKTDSAVQLWHKPTGIMIRVEAERSQHQNLLTAKAILAARLQDAQTTAAQKSRNDMRKSLLGSGQRGDKIRSIALQRDQVVDHRLGKRTSAAKYMKGDLTDLLG